MSEFELDEEIELSFDFDFKHTVKRGKFKHREPMGRYWAVDKKSIMIYGAFARKIDPKVTIKLFNANNKSDGFYEISKELADKIKRGDV